MMQQLKSQNALAYTKNSLNTDEKSVFWFSYLQKLMRKNESETYQNIEINYARTVDSLTRNAIQYIELIVNCLQNHFEDPTRLMLQSWTQIM